MNKAYAHKQAVVRVPIYDGVLSVEVSRYPYNELTLLLHKTGELYPVFLNSLTFDKETDIEKDARGLMRNYLTTTLLDAQEWAARARKAIAILDGNNDE